MKNKIAFISAYSFPELISSGHLTVDVIEMSNKAGFETLFISPNQIRGLNKRDVKKYKSDRLSNDKYHNHLVLKSFSLFERNIIFRTLRYRYFASRAIKYLKHNFNPDYIFLWSYPPLGMSKAIVKFAKMNGIKIIFNVHDIQPEILNCSGLIKKIIGKSTQFVLHKADYVFTLSEDMKKSLSKKAEIDIAKITVIPPWNYVVDKETVLCNDLKTFFDNRSRFVVGYIGNIGKFQNIELLLTVAKSMERYNSIDFLFVGSGAMYSKVKEAASNSNNIICYPKVSENDAVLLYNMCDLNIISLKTNLINYCCPSKTPLVLLSPKPILTITDASDYSNSMSKYGSRCVNNFNVEDIVECILDVLKNPKERKVIDTVYNRDYSLKYWYDFFTDLYDKN